MAMTCKIEGTKGKGQKLVIEIDLEIPRPSASGKTMVVASSHGNTKTDAMLNGQQIVVGLNAYVRKE